MSEAGIEPTVSRHHVAVEERHERRRDQSGSGVSGRRRTDCLFMADHLRGARGSARHVAAPVARPVIDHDQRDAAFVERREGNEHPSQRRGPVVDRDHDGHIGERAGTVAGPDRMRQPSLEERVDQPRGRSSSIRRDCAEDLGERGPGGERVDHRVSGWAESKEAKG